MTTLKTEFELKANSGYVLCERGYDRKINVGHGDLLLPGSAKSEDVSLVLSVGPLVKTPVRVGEYIAYAQGAAFKKLRGPNGGELFAVMDNQIVAVHPSDGVWPRPMLRAPFAEDGTPVPPTPTAVNTEKSTNGSEPATASAE